jgi:UDP-glucuronate 4-epimerase
MAHSYSSLYGLPTTGLRFFTVYGPWGRPDMALFLFTKKILAGEPIDVYYEGHHQRDFTYVDDIVKGVVAVVDHIAEADPHWNSEAPDPSGSRAPYKIYNIGNQRPVTLLRFIEVLEHCLGRKAIKNLMPIQPGDVPDTSADVDALARDVGYRPSTELTEGVKQFVEWYLDYYHRQPS